MLTENTLVFCRPGHEGTADKIAAGLGCGRGEVTFHTFPDGESYVRLDSDVRGKRLIMVCGLDHPDQKIMGLIYFCHVAREMSAASIILVAPYLGYMRQDVRFKAGEAVTSKIFAGLLSGIIDGLVTVDPHLHRYHSLDEIYSAPSRVLHATGLISRWIRRNITRPVLIGPDEESEQWVRQVAEKADAPYMILRKIRRGDREIEVSVPEVEKYRDCIPVLVDDIISTARTMIGTVAHLQKAGMQAPVCIGAHAIFAGDAYAQLRAAGVARVVTCDSIRHESNEIPLGDLIAEQLSRDLATGYFR